MPYFSTPETGTSNHGTVLYIMVASTALAISFHISPIPLVCPLALLLFLAVLLLNPPLLPSLQVGIHLFPDPFRLQGLVQSFRMGRQLTKSQVLLQR